MPAAYAGGSGSGLPPSTETVQRVRDLALLLGLDPDMVDQALLTWIDAYEPISRQREPGADDE